MRIGLLHGYELTGSGSNEYVRYLSRALARLGHEVHVLCREPDPRAIAHIGRAIAWDAAGKGRELFAREAEGRVVLHQLPHGDVRPVYLTDKQRGGNVKSFLELSDAELEGYHALYVKVVRAVLHHHRVDVLLANHLVWQPAVAAETGVPFIVFPHGSSLEYTVRQDPRCARAARDALEKAAGLVTGSREVLDRILALFPDRRDMLLAKSTIVGVGVDTALFAPVPRGGRRVALAALAGAYRGKRPAQRAELRERLDRGEFDAVADYHEAYDHAEPDADLAETLAGIPWEEGKVCLFVGALTAGKGVQGLLAAFPRLLPAHLVVVGSGAYREVLEALVHAIATGHQPLFRHLCRHGFDLDRSGLRGGWPDIGGEVTACPALADHVHFLGRLDHDRLRHLFPCADLAVFPSVLPEAYPLVLMESLANGVLPVVSDFSGFADGLKTLVPLLGADLVDKMRLPVEPDRRVSGIAARLERLLAGNDLATHKKTLRRTAETHLDWTPRAQEMASVLLRTVSG